jgi:hypothetical protein
VEGDADGGDKQEQARPFGARAGHLGAHEAEEGGQDGGGEGGVDGAE